MEKLLKPAEKVIYDHPSGYGIMDVFHHRYRVQVEKDMVERRKVYRPLMAYARRSRQGPCGGLQNMAAGTDPSPEDLRHMLDHNKSSE